MSNRMPFNPTLSHSDSGCGAGHRSSVGLFSVPFVAFSHNQSGAAATITRRASAPPHRAIRADDCRIDFTSSSGKPGARPYVAGLRHAADADSHRDRNTSWSRLFKLLLFGRRRWIVLEDFFHRFVAQIDVFFRGISAGILPPNHVANTHQRDPMGITVLHGGSIWQGTRLQTERVESDNTIPMGKPVR